MTKAIKLTTRKDRIGEQSNRRKVLDETGGNLWLAKRFDIPVEDILWYNAGICYSRITVRSRESALKVREAVRHDSVNGGMLDGMQLGGISKMCDDSGYYYDVTC
jgi:hypothetical protein